MIPKNKSRFCCDQPGTIGKIYVFKTVLIFVPQMKKGVSFDNQTYDEYGRAFRRTFFQAEKSRAAP